MPGLSHALVPAQESKRWSFGRLLLLPIIQKSLFLGPKKSRKIRHANTGPPQFKIPATDAVCVKVASSLTFCAHSSLQSFSTSDKMKGPKTGLPGGTTFDPKRVHFWVPSEIYLLCARVQNWALTFIWCLPGGLFDAPSNSNYELAKHQRHRASNKGGPHRVSKKSADFRC